MEWRTKLEMNEEVINFMARVAEVTANQTRDGIVDMLTYLAEQSLQNPEVPNHVANTLVATIATIKEVDVADFFAAGDN